jgi:hypothetical protein
MLGKLSSVETVVKRLKELQVRYRYAKSESIMVDMKMSTQIDNYALTEFVQGQTRRWAIGWSHTDVRLSDVCLMDRFPMLPSDSDTGNCTKG